MSGRQFNGHLSCARSPCEGPGVPPRARARAQTCHELSVFRYLHSLRLDSLRVYHSDYAIYKRKISLVGVSQAMALQAGSHTERSSRAGPRISLCRKPICQSRVYPPTSIFSSSYLSRGGKCCLPSSHLIFWITSKSQ